MTHNDTQWHVMTHNATQWHAMTPQDESTGGNHANALDFARSTTTALLAHRLEVHGKVHPAHIESGNCLPGEAGSLNGNGGLRAVIDPLPGPII